MGDVVLGELHDAHRERSNSVIRDDAFADPQTPAAADPADREMPIRRVTATLLLDSAATAETLTGLRVVQDGVGPVDGVLGLAVAPLGGVPVFGHPGPGPAVTVHGSAPPAKGFATVSALWSKATGMAIMAPGRPATTVRYRAGSSRSARLPPLPSARSR